MCLDGACQPVGLAAGTLAPGYLAVDGTSVYWTSAGASDERVMKVGIDGGDPVRLADGHTPWGIAVNATHVYWANAGDGTVWRAGLDGGGAATLATGLCGPGAIALDEANVYWTNGGPPSTDGESPSPDCGPPSNGVVMAMPLDGGFPVVLAPSQRRPWGIAVDASYVYWVNFTNPGSVWKVAKGGGEPVALAAPQTFPIGITVDATSVYWTNNDIADGGVMKVGIDGGDPVVLAPASGPLGVAVDATNVYWAEPGRGAVMRVPLGGGMPSWVASGQNTPNNIRLSTTAVYWTAGSNMIWKVAK
jgi:hypothetical protein